MSKSKKDLRRAAGIREHERRAENFDQENLSNSDAVEWGTAQILDESIRLNILRLGGTPDSPNSTDPVLILSQQINWPTRSFDSSESRYRRAFSVDMNDIVIQDSVWPWCRDFRFCKNGEFYTNWRKDFTACDLRYAPIGADSHYFYLISTNQSNVGDPTVFRVDHETVNETPYNQADATFKTLIDLLTPT